MRSADITLLIGKQIKVYKYRVILCGCIGVGDYDTRGVPLLARACGLGMAPDAYRDGLSGRFCGNGSFELGAGRKLWHQPGVHFGRLLNGLDFLSRDADDR